MTLEEAFQPYMNLAPKVDPKICHICPFYVRSKPIQTSYCSATHDFTGAISPGAKCKETKGG